jgi:hypothetical protein
MTFTTPQSDRAVGFSSIANSVQIAGNFNIVDKLQLNPSDEEPAPTQAAAGKPALEPPSNPRSISPANENADSRDRCLSPNAGLEAGRALVPRQNAKRESRLLSLALLSVFAVATFGWLWFLFQVGKWLLDF